MEQKYWLWKPYIILKKLQSMQAGEILIYLDAGTEVISSLEPIINVANLLVCKSKQFL